MRRKKRSTNQSTLLLPFLFIVLPLNLSFHLTAASTHSQSALSTSPSYRRPSFKARKVNRSSRRLRQAFASPLLPLPRHSPLFPPLLHNDGPVGDAARLERRVNGDGQHSAADGAGASWRTREPEENNRQKKTLIRLSLSLPLPLPFTMCAAGHNGRSTTTCGSGSLRWRRWSRCAARAPLAEKLQ